MWTRWLLRGFLFLFLCLSGCAGGATVPSPPATPHAEPPIIAVPDDCRPLAQYQSTDGGITLCVAVVCESGRIVRTKGCSATAEPPAQLTEQQLAELRERIDESDFFTQQPYFPAATDC